MIRIWLVSLVALVAGLAGALSAAATQIGRAHV